MIEEVRLGERCGFDESVKCFFQAGEKMTLGFLSPSIFPAPFSQGCALWGCSPSLEQSVPADSGQALRVKGKLRRGPGTSRGSSVAPTPVCIQLLQLDTLPPTVFGLLSRNPRRAGPGAGPGEGDAWVSAHSAESNAVVVIPPQENRML